MKIVELTVGSLILTVTAAIKWNPHNLDQPAQIREKSTEGDWKSVVPIYDPSSIQEFNLDSIEPYG